MTRAEAARQVAAVRPIEVQVGEARVLTPVARLDPGRSGGRATDTVSRKTACRVVGVAPGRGPEVARRLGVATLDEAGLRRMVQA